MTFGIPLCRTHMSKNSFDVPTVVVFVWVSANLANFKNLSTTTKMASVPFHSARHIIKSVKIHSNGPKGIGKGLYSQIFSYVPTLYFNTSHTCGHNVLHLPSFQANKKFSPTTFLSTFHHGVPPWAHHALLA